MPTGRVAVFTTSGVPFDIVELPTPVVDPGGLLVKNTHAIICGSDLHGWRGDGDVPMAPVRKLTGHEFTGVVHSLGKGVVTDSLRRPLRSRETAWRSRFSTRAIDAFGAFEANITLAVIAVDGTRWTSIRIATLVWRITTISRLGTTSSRCRTNYPPMRYHRLTVLFRRYLFGLERARMEFGDTVVVQGAGGLGIYATSVASEKGASKVIVIDGQQPRLDLAMKCGATDTVSMADYPTPESRVERVRELTHGVGADVVVEVVGIAAATLEGLDMVRVNGKYVDIGNIGGGSIEFPAAKIIANQTQWLGTVHYDPWIIEEALQFLVRVQDRMPCGGRCFA